MHKLALASSAKHRQPRYSTILNICMVFEIDEREGQHFIVMEFLDGLSRRLCSRRQDAINFEPEGHVHV